MNALVARIHCRWCSRTFPANVIMETDDRIASGEVIEA
jgi:hypothetical protein